MTPSGCSLKVWLYHTVVPDPETKNPMSCSMGVAKGVLCSVRSLFCMSGVFMHMCSCFKTCFKAVVCYLINAHVYPEEAPALQQSFVQPRYHEQV